MSDEKRRKVDDNETIDCESESSESDSDLVEDFLNPKENIQCELYITNYHKLFSCNSTHDKMIKKLMDLSVSDELYRCLYEKSYYEAYKIMDNNHNFNTITHSQIVKLYKLIDKIYYNGYLNKKRSISTQDVHIEGDRHKEFKQYAKTIITTRVNLNDKFFAKWKDSKNDHTTIYLHTKNIFEMNSLPNYKHVIVNGILCMTKLQELLSILKHESVHQLIGRNCDTENCNHGEDFHKISYNLYRHTLYTCEGFMLQRRCDDAYLKFAIKTFDDIKNIEGGPFNRFTRKRVLYKNKDMHQRLGYPLYTKGKYVTDKSFVIRHILQNGKFKDVEVPCENLIDVYQQTSKKYAPNQDALDFNEPTVTIIDPDKIIKMWEHDS